METVSELVFSALMTSDLDCETQCNSLGAQP